MKSNYSLEIVSHYPQNKQAHPLKMYEVGGIPTVGALPNEPFEIKFRNDSWNKVQIKISLDGTDILTGGTATTEVTPQMWVVNGNATLTLKAWPESTKGGAAFVFTDTENSVAAHTHGDLSSRGIIAAAVYTEGHIEYKPYKKDDWWWFNDSRRMRLRAQSSKSLARPETLSYNPSEPALESNAAVGAGEFVNQKIEYVQGLKKPVLDRIITVKYVWWNQLKERLESEYVASSIPGFPGDKEKKLISLGSTPRIKTGKSPQPIFSRI